MALVVLMFMMMGRAVITVEEVIQVVADAFVVPGGIEVDPVGGIHLD